MRKWYPFQMNDSYRKWSRAVGIDDETMIKHYANRDREIANKELPRTRRIKKMKRKKIKAKSPILIVGAGPSSEDYNAIRKWKGKIACVDVMFNILCYYQIRCDYIIILETGVRPIMFEESYLEQCQGKAEFVFSSLIHRSLDDLANKHNAPFTRWKTPEEIRCSNVGLFAVVYSHDVLKCDKILLLGFEHVGDKYDQREYQRWQYDFWYFIQKWDKETIVNCSQGGALYYKDFIIDSNLGELEIGN